MWLLQEGAGRGRRRAGWICAALPTLIALLTLAEYGLGRDLGIDELLFTDHGAGPIPGRLAFSTALALLLLGLSFFAHERETRTARVLADGSALGAGLLGLSGLLGFAAEGPGLLVSRSFGAMASPTAMAILLLAAGSLAARPRSGLKRHVSGTGAGTGGVHRLIVIGFAFALGMVISMAWWQWRQATRANEMLVWVAHAREVRYELSALLACLQDIETGERGFVVTGDPAFLAPFLASRARVNDQFRAVRTLTRDNARQQAHCDTLGPLIARRVALSQRNVDLRQRSGFEAAQREVASGSGKAVMDALRAEIALMDREEQTLMATRSAAARREAEGVTRLIVIIAGLSIALLIVVFALLLRENRLRRQASLALQESETMFRSFFELSPDLVCISDIVDGRFLRINASFSRVLGYSEDELLAKPFMELIHPDDRDSTARVVREQLERDETPLSFENRYVRRDGSTVRLEWAAQPIPEKGLSFGIARDVTARKRSEEQISELNDELRRRASELEAANKELESFSYSVSHDLRAPLRHIQGYVEMLTEATTGQLSDEALRCLKTITNASIEMGQLIDDLLAFSRMGRIELHHSRVPLDRVVQETIRGLEIATKGRNIVWRVEPLPQVLGDTAMLKQVFANLVGNAVKYSRHRDPAEIEIGCAGEEDGRLIVFVRDNGAGFDMQYAHKLFGVFQRLHRADDFEGTGIGLAIVQRIIDRHEGRIWADGALNRGATFYFTLKPAAAV